MLCATPAGHLLSLLRPCRLPTASHQPLPLLPPSLPSAKLQRVERQPGVARSPSGRPPLPLRLLPQLQLQQMVLALLLLLRRRQRWEQQQLGLPLAARWRQQ